MTDREKAQALVDMYWAAHAEETLDAIADSACELFGPSPAEQEVLAAAGRWFDGWAGVSPAAFAGTSTGEQLLGAVRRLRESRAPQSRYRIGKIRQGLEHWGIYNESGSRIASCQIEDEAMQIAKLLNESESR